MTDVCDRPLAAAPYLSYRCASPHGYGWIMIGAKDDADALREAQRSNRDARREDLQRWNGTEYVPA